MKDFNDVHDVSVTAVDGGGPECPERRCFRQGRSDYDQAVKKQDPNPGYKHLWLEPLPDNYQAGRIIQVRVERPEWLRWMNLQFQRTEVNFNISNSNGIILKARRHHSTTAAKGCSVQGLKRCGAGGGVKRLSHTEGKLSFH